MPQNYSPAWGPFMTGVGTPPFVAGENPPNPWQMLYRRLAASQAQPSPADISGKPLEFGEQPVSSAQASAPMPEESPSPYTAGMQIPPQRSPIPESVSPQPLDEIGYAMRMGRAIVPEPSSPYAFLSPTEWGQRHPRAAGAMENALLGARSAMQGNTFAEQLINGLGGLADERVRMRQAQEALPAEQLKTGMWLAEWMDKQRRGMQEGEQTAAMAPVERQLKQAQAAAQQTSAIGAGQYTLGPGDVRRGPRGEIIAEGLPESVTMRPNIQSTVRPDPTSKTGYAEFAVGIDTSTGQIAWERRIGDAPKPSEGPDKTFRQLGVSIQLANSLKSHPAYTDMLDIDTGMQGVEVGLSQENGFGDIAAINAFQRMVDPGATVREGDVALIQTASSLLSRILSDYPIERLREGDQLPRATRVQMLKAAKELYSRRAKNYNDIVGSQYKALSENAGVPFEMVGRDFPPIQGQGAPEVPPSTSAPSIGEIKTFPNGRRGRWDGTGWEAVD